MTKTLPEVTEPKAGQSVPSLIEALQPEIARALPKSIDEERFTRIVLTVYKSNSQLQGCDPYTLLAAVMLSAQLGLEPGPLGHVYFVPFRNKGSLEVQFIIGYRGLIALALRSPDVFKVEARAVYEGDVFAYQYGTNPTIDHVPSGNDNPQEITHVYAVAHLNGDVTQFDVMTFAEVNRIRDEHSKAAKSEYGPWRQQYTAMAKKTVVRRLFPYLPSTVDAQYAASADETVQRQIVPHGAVVVPVEVSQVDDLLDDERPFE